MAEDNGLAAFHSQRLPLLHLTRHVNDLPLPHRNSQRPRSSDGPVLKTIHGSARDRLGQSSLPLPPPSPIPSLQPD